MRSNTWVQHFAYFFTLVSRRIMSYSVHHQFTLYFTYFQHKLSNTRLHLFWMLDQIQITQHFLGVKWWNAKEEIKWFLPTFLSELAVLLRNYCHPHFIAWLALVLLMSTLPSVNKYTASLCNSLNGAVYNPSGTLWASDFHVLVQSSLEKLCFIVHKRIWYFLCQSIYILIFSDSNTWSISFCFYI